MLQWGVTPRDRRSHFGRLEIECDFGPGLKSVFGFASKAALIERLSGLEITLPGRVLYRRHGDGGPRLEDPASTSFQRCKNLC